MQFKNLDANGAVFFQRQLELIKSRTYDVLYADLQARSLFPVNNEGGSGITSITFRTFDKVGMAKIINNYAKDLPRADVAGKETTIPVRELGISFGYTVKEIESSRLTGVPLDQRRADAALRAIEEEVNNIAFNGHADSGLPGFFSNENIPTGTAPNGGWATATPDQILFDINDTFGDVFEDTQMKERADTLLLSPDKWNLITSTARSTNSDTTILQYVVNNSPFLNSADDVIPVNEVATGEMWVYTRRPDKVELQIPSELQFFAPQEQGLEFVVPGMSSIAGINLYYPLSAAHRTGL